MAACYKHRHNITFLMLFVIQQSQNIDTLALHLKLNELIAANEYTSYRLVASEELTEEKLMNIKKYANKLSFITKYEESILNLILLMKLNNIPDQKNKNLK